MKSRRTLKLLICGLLASVSVLCFSGCSSTLFDYFYNGALLGAVDIGREIGKGTTEAFLTNEHTKDVVPFIRGKINKVIVFVDDFLYNALGGE